MKVVESLSVVKNLAWKFCFAGRSVHNINVIIGKLGSNM